jgi:hypothetical protein
MDGFGRGKIYEEYYKPYVVSSNTANTTFTLSLSLFLHTVMHPNFWGLRLVTVKSELLMNLFPMEPCYCDESYLFWQKLALRPYELVFCILGVFDKDPDPRNRTSELRIRILLFLQWLSRFKQEIGLFSTFISFS